MAGDDAGEQGEVVISNLVNGASVLLNYPVGDVAAMSTAPCPCGRTFRSLSELEGRVEDILPLADGRFVHPLSVLWFGLMGSLMLAFLGLLTSIWADKFDHSAVVTNFVVAPLSLLSGTFYSVQQLSPAFRAISHANPFFYVISGFRHGFLGEADSPIYVGAIGLFVLNVLLFGICYLLLRSGWKIKN